MQEEDDDALLELPDEGPELRLMRAQFGTELKKAFFAALDTLAPRDRTVLRLYAVDGLNIEQIGVAYDVHRATVARWIATSRAHLLAETRRQLGATLSLLPSDLNSLLRMVDGQLDLSLGWALRRKGD